MRISSRVPRNLDPSALARLARQSSIEFDLTESNPTRIGLDLPSDRILPALSRSASLRYAPHPFGLLAAREAIAAYYQGTVDPSRIVLTSSTSESYSWIFKLLCNPGDAILVPRPSYPLFECLAQLDAVQVRQYPLIERMEWAIDFAALEQLITPAVKAIVLVNPNNPTGSFLKRWELDTLAALCRRHDLSVISDEVFRDYTWQEDPDRVSTLVTETRVPVFVFSGLSKLAALPQMKLGWIVAPPAALPALEWIADAYLPVSAPVQYAASPWLEAAVEIREQIRTRVATNWAALRQNLEGTLARVVPSEGGWCAIIQAPAMRTDEEWTTVLLERGILVQPGFFYDFERESFLVVSLLPDPAVFKAAASRLREIWSSELGGKLPR